MSLLHTSYVDTQLLPHPIADVWDWHTRPGALTRLAPPWQPVGVEAEADSLRDGAAVLRMPAGRRWVAQHRPDGFEEGRRFTDELASRPFVVPVSWRHEHTLEASLGGNTLLTDHVETTSPERLLRPMFRYRHAQLAGDLAAHAWARALRPEPMRVAVTGASGLVGTALCALLTGGGHEVVRLVRHRPGAGERQQQERQQQERQWDPQHDSPARIAESLSDVDAVVHLAGASIAGRFTHAHRREVRESRIGPTRRIAEAVALAGVPVLVSASAIGFYGADRGDEELTETSERGTGFLSEVVRDWEEATAPASGAGARVVLVRTGIVQSPRGGALRVQRPLFEVGLGGRLGDGTQWLSWIGIDDMVDIYLRALVDDRLAGPVNAVAPEPVTGSTYASALGHAMHRPAVLPTPGFGPALLLGAQGARETALASQRVLPTRLLELGHTFRFPTVEPALKHLFGAR